MDIVGGKAKMVLIPVPTGKKVKGKIVELKLSTKFEGLLDIKIEFPQYKKKSDDGKREFTKQAFYGVPVDWSEKNKAGRLLMALYGKLPTQEQVNWSKALQDREVDCIFEDVFDEQTGEAKGQKIKWIGKPGAAAPEEEKVMDMDRGFDAPEMSGDPEVNTDDTPF